MSDREAVLSRLPRVSGKTAPSVALPERRWTTFADPAATFTEILESVGGRALTVAAADVRRRVEAVADDVGAARWRVELPGWSSGATTAATDLDLLVVGGDVVVAENAAIWVVPATDELRAALFLTQHLALVVSRRAMVHTMHEAYAAIDVAASGYGVFISGPSKTADIEQSLVIGAHGPRSLTVLLVDEPAG